MKVVFLDFDGVVVCLSPEKDRTATGKSVRAANRQCVAHLNRLVAATGAVVVVSSTWRRHHDMHRLQALLDRAGFRGQVIGVTPIHDRDDSGKGPQRGDEIAAWLRVHRARGEVITSYVVLDDDGDVGQLPAERWVVIRDGWRAGGLQAEHVDRAIAVLR